MGASTYYSGKGSTSRRDIMNDIESRRTKTSNKSAMITMLELLEEVERCRDVVADKQKDLDIAKNNLKRAEQKVSAQMNKLDSETKLRLQRMISGTDSKELGGR